MNIIVDIYSAYPNNYIKNTFSNFPTIIFNKKSYFSIVYTSGVYQNKIRHYVLDENVNPMHFDNTKDLIIYLKTYLSEIHDNNI